MGEVSLQDEDQMNSEADPSPTPSKIQSVKFKTATQSSSDLPSKPSLIKSEDKSETTIKENSSAYSKPSVTAALLQTGSPDEPLKNQHDSQGLKDLEGYEGPESSHSHRKTSQDEKSSAEAASATKTSLAAVASRYSRSVLAETEYTVSEDGNIHINDEQKAAIRRLMHPEDQEESVHLGFTKQGKPIQANPYFKYALRAKDGAEDSKPLAPAVTEPHASRLTRRSRRDSTHLPSGPSTVLEKIKEEFCEWLASLGSRRNMTVSKERLEELFSLGLENSLVVRPPEIRMTQSCRARPPSSTRSAQQQTAHQVDQQQAAQQATQQTAQKAAQRRPLQRHPLAAADKRRKTETTVVTSCRSPSLTYYPELREKWLQMGLRQRRPVWRSGRRLVGPPPPRVRYGEWYIPIRKWTPLAAGRRLAPPETDEARQLRQRQLANRKLNETLSRSHAMAALREYIQIRQLQGDPTFPANTPKLVRDVDQLVPAVALESRTSRGGLEVGERRLSLPMAGLRVKVLDKGQQRQRAPAARRGSSRRPTDVTVKEPLLAKPPPMYRPVKTEPGHAARGKRKLSNK